MLDVCLLGTGGMIPLPNRFLTSMIATFNGRKLLIDCGEGTQVSMRLAGVKCKNLDIICITHFHGDHVTGLPGLLLTVNNTGRTEPITFIGPPGLKSVIEGLTVVCRDLNYKIECIELSFEEHNLKIGEFDIHAIPLNHNVQCFGYVIENKRAAKFLVDKAKKNNVPVQAWKYLQNGQTVEMDGKQYTPDMVLGTNRKGIKVAYFTDSRPTRNMPIAAKDADLLICEAMYTDDSYLDQVKKHKHMLASEAAKIAKEAGAKELWLTHYSPALLPTDIDISSVKEIFENVVSGKDRMTTVIKFEE